ncbi:MAG: class I SAM-dependent methyltransferase [Chitinophagales bacterium]
MQAGLIRHLISRIFSPANRDQDPGKAYNIWSGHYDDQEGNLVLALDNQLFRRFISNKQLAGLTIADIGCGTGRHWHALLDQNPKRLIGFDISTGMLAQLNKKFPGAETYVLRNAELSALENESCDLIVSTLAIAHMPDLKPVLQEWKRVLKPGGEIIITDFHPEALAKGNRRTYAHEGKWKAVKSYIHPIQLIRDLADALALSTIELKEIRLNEEMRSFYERKNAIPVFELNKGLAIIYGIILKKSYAAAKS